MTYKIEWIDDEGTDRLEGKTFKNKDAVISELCLMVEWIIGDNVSVHSNRKMTYQQAMRICLLYTSPSPRDRQKSRMPSSA